LALQQHAWPFAADWQQAIPQLVALCSMGFGATAPDDTAHMHTENGAPHASASGTSDMRTAALSLELLSHRSMLSGFSADCGAEAAAQIAELSCVQC
jgi:hypothetical protein